MSLIGRKKPDPYDAAHEHARQVSRHAFSVSQGLTAASKAQWHEEAARAHLLAAEAHAKTGNDRDERMHRTIAARHSDWAK